jgi:hypothetical protein
MTPLVMLHPVLVKFNGRATRACIISSYVFDLVATPGRKKKREREKERKRERGRGRGRGTPPKK